MEGGEDRGRFGYNIVVRPFDLITDEKPSRICGMLLRKHSMIPRESFLIDCAPLHTEGNSAARKSGYSVYFPKCIFLSIYSK